MEIRPFLSALLLSVFVLTSACSTSGGALAPTRAVEITATGVQSESANIIGAAQVGDTVQLPAGNPLGATSANVLAEYFAASNRLCRQVLPSGVNTNGVATLATVRLACERGDGNWEWVRSLTTSSASRPLPAVATVSSVSETDPLIVEHLVQGH